LFTAKGPDDSALAAQALRLERLSLGCYTRLGSFT